MGEVTLSVVRQVDIQVHAVFSFIAMIVIAIACSIYAACVLTIRKILIARSSLLSYVVTVVWWVLHAALRYTSQDLVVGGRPSTSCAAFSRFQSGLAPADIPTCAIGIGWGQLTLQVQLHHEVITDNQPYLTESSHGIASFMKMPCSTMKDLLKTHDRAPCHGSVLLYSDKVTTWVVLTLVGFYKGVCSTHQVLGLLLPQVVLLNGLDFENGTPNMDLWIYGYLSLTIPYDQSYYQQPGQIPHTHEA
ncbi:hypothetical protein G9A89_000454, partial [Geosiphon pyriformis]